MKNYKSYFLRQLGLKESQFKPSDVNDPYDNIDPDELRKGTEDEKDEHGFSTNLAQRTAVDHLKEPNQTHYYSGVDAAKKAGMLKEKSPFSAMSPTAKSPTILAIGIRGTPGGMMPSQAMAPTSLPPSDTAIAPDGAGVDPKSKAALGGLQLASKQTPNSTIVNGTPKNNMLQSSRPVSDIVPPTPATEHPDQVQQVSQTDDIPAQALTGTTSNSDSPMGEKPEPEDFDVNDIEVDGTDLDIPKGEDEIDPNMVNETFARHKKLMREKLGIKEEKTEECKDCGCNKPNTTHGKKTPKLSEKKLNKIKEGLYRRAFDRALTEQEIEAVNVINETLKNRKK